MSEAAISETVSKKRGRPEVFGAEGMSMVRMLYPELRSKRQQVAKGYELLAVGSLRRDNETVDGVDRIFNTADNTYRATVLEQLGRFKIETDCDDELIIEIARLLNTLFADDPMMTTREAVTRLRRARARQRGTEARQ
jgi:hypothetical protein